MTAAFVQQKFATAAATSVGVTITGVGANHHISAGVGNTTATSATTSSPSATWANAIADFSAAGGIIHLRTDYTENVVSGSWTITGHGTGSTATSITVYESSGVATSTSLGVHQTGSAASTSTSLSAAVTPSAGSVLYTWLTDDGSSGSTASTITSVGNSAFTVDQLGGAGSAWDESSIPLGSAHFNNSAAASTNVTWTAHNTGVGNTTTMLTEFLASGGAVAAVLNPMRTLRGAGL